MSPASALVLRCARRFRGRLALTLVAILAQVTLDVLEPMPLKVLIDNVLRRRPLRVGGLGPVSNWLATASAPALLVVACGTLLTLAAVSAALEYAWSSRATRLAQAISFDVRAALFRHVQRLPISFFATRPSGEVVHRITSDVANVKEMLVAAVTLLVANVLLIVGIAFVLVRLDPLLAVATLSISVPLYIVTRSQARDAKKASRRARAQEGEVVGFVQEAINAARITKAFAREEHEGARFDVKNKQSHQAGSAQASVEARLNPLLDVVRTLGVSLVIYLGATRCMSGELSVGTLVAILTYQKALHNPIRQLSKLSGALAKGSIGLERISEILDERPETADDAASIVPRLRGAVSFEHVWFSYGSERERVALNDVTFSVPAGSKVALVGSSGAGKTTLVNLIPRFYDPTYGVVRIDGRDVSQLGFDGLRRQVAVVAQEAVLFRATVWENIAYGLPEAPAGFDRRWLASLPISERRRIFERVRAAACDANALEFIKKLPNGFDTVLSERGADLSGGQRQRIAIARALIRNAPILILDEPTTGLDAESEALVMQALERLMARRTSFVIAHRLATVRRADVILVVEQGRIVEFGSHAELSRRPGRYRELENLERAGRAFQAISRRRSVES